MRPVPDTEDGEQEDLLEGSPRDEGRRRGQPLFGVLLVLTPLIAGVATIHVGPPAGGMAAVGMSPLLLLATYVEPFPPTPLRRLMEDREG